MHVRPCIYAGAHRLLQIWRADETSEQLTACELYREYFTEIGINAKIYTTDGTLLDGSRKPRRFPSVWFG